MAPGSSTVLLVEMKTQLSHAMESDLALAGFEVVSVADPRKLLEAARGRSVAALVISGQMTPGLWRRWTRDPHVRGVPVVVASRRPRQLPLPWPLAAFVRADAYVSARDLKRRGAAADAVRAVAARGAAIAPTGRERIGEGLWHIGSVLWLVGVLLALLTLVEFALGPTPGAILRIFVFSAGTGRVLMDVGESVGLGQSLRLHWESWIWIALVLLLARSSFVHS